MKLRTIKRRTQYVMDFNAIKCGPRFNGYSCKWCRAWGARP